MAKRDVEFDILNRLNVFVVQGNILPATVDGKVNVIALCKKLSLAPADAQHFHRKDSLKSAVNGIATEQGLLLIGARGPLQDAGELKLEARIARTSAKARLDAIAATETSSAIMALSEELIATQAKVAALEAQNRSLMERMRLLENVGLTFDFDL